MRGPRELALSATCSLCLPPHPHVRRGPHPPEGTSSPCGRDIRLRLRGSPPRPRRSRGPCIGGGSSLADVGSKSMSTISAIGGPADEVLAGVLTNGSRRPSSTGTGPPPLARGMAACSARVLTNCAFSVSNSRCSPGLSVEEVHAQVEALPTGPGRLLLGAGTKPAVVQASAMGLERLASGFEDRLALVRWILEDLWARGIDPSGVVLVGLELDASTMESASVAGAGADVAWRLLDDQLRRRRRGDVPSSMSAAEWLVTVNGFDPRLERFHESLLTLADGCLGTRRSARWRWCGKARGFPHGCLRGYVGRRASLPPYPCGHGDRIPRPFVRRVGSSISAPASGTSRDRWPRCGSPRWFGPGPGAARERRRRASAAVRNTERARPRLRGVSRRAPPRCSRPVRQLCPR